MNDALRLARQLGEQLTARRYALATAESCTGGLIGHLITEVAGSSAYYLGGIVAYSNDVKQSLLGVAEDTLLTHGAVSEPTAREMAQGARHRLGAHIAVATTGIAGPGGGTDTKPVGLVYIAVAAPDALRCERFVFSGDRHAIKHQTATAALRLLLDALQ
jgi:nicotinamide-nucleotide amidase